MFLIVEVVNPLASLRSVVTAIETPCYARGDLNSEAVIRKRLNRHCFNLTVFKFVAQNEGLQNNVFPG
jgi:hypothetical protein